MMIFFVLLLAIPCLTIKKRKAQETDILDYKSCLCLKGVLCLFVMFHNLGLDYYTENEPIRELIAEHCGGVAVGLFFFLSAYGIVKAYQQKGNKFFVKLIFVNILKLYLVSVLINILIYFVYFQGAFSNSDTLLRIFNLDIFNNFNRMNRHGWYIPTIIILYLLFSLIYYLCSKLKTDKRFIIAAIILSLIAISSRLLTTFLDMGGTYTREITAFATGLIYATFYKQINEFVNKYFWYSLSISFVCLIVGFCFYEPLATHASALFIITVAQKITWQHPVTFFLGKICLGVYLFLYFSTLIMQQFLYSPCWWFLLNASFILLLSILLYGVQLIIEKCIKFIANKCSKKSE